jgi:hypothetical protein
MPYDCVYELIKLKRFVIFKYVSCLFVFLFVNRIAKSKAIQIMCIWSNNGGVKWFNLPIYPYLNACTQKILVRFHMSFSTQISCSYNLCENQDFVFKLFLIVSHKLLVNLSEFSYIRHSSHWKYMCCWCSDWSGWGADTTITIASSILIGGQVYLDFSTGTLSARD